MDEHGCPSCDRRFDSRKGLAVHHWRSHGELLPNRDCRHCGAAFHAPHEQKYCSDSCREQAVSFEGRDNPNYRGGTETGTCKSCGTEFEYYPSEKRGLYCQQCVETEAWRAPPSASGSDNPRWLGGKRTVACTVCRADVERWPSELSENPVCSEECRREWLSESFAGEGHPNWKDGGSPSYGPGWNEVRRRALERDGYQCRLCTTTRDELGRNPDVHHITPVREIAAADEHTPADAHFLQNVVCLCPSCHRKAEFGNVPRERLRALVSGTDEDGD